MIKRQLQDTIQKYFFNDQRRKAILIFGARQVGKTTLLESIVQKTGISHLHLNGDEPDVRQQLEKITSTQLKMLFGNHKLIIIDEAQNITNIGLTLKLITDKIKDVQVIATGSSAFELANKFSESLTGRKYEFHLFPLSFKEMIDNHGLLEEKRLLKHRLVYGYYPEIVTNPGMEGKLLKLLAGSYLYKDLLMLEQIKKPVLLEKILAALALQLGSEVSYSEIANTIRADSNTVEKYIDLLEKTYIIFRLPALNKNVRNEIRKGKKIYFWDNGIRNAIVGNFQPVQSRADTGALWENFIICERLKNNRYNESDAKSYFWRTTQQQEIDYIEEVNGAYHLFEFKWNEKNDARFSKTFLRSYKIASQKLVHPGNLEEFIL
ncbi:MAG: ATP-binding protein [Bacteroidales bacterium]|jgi:predicted AAA+ superfamily ATPase|nr:ATP-binding protein [Bacteroidales bacterium]NLM91961.1 ATP-binding protein [Bacteroidales bacterium]